MITRYNTLKYLKAASDLEDSTQIFLKHRKCEVTIYIRSHTIDKLNSRFVKLLS